VSSLHISLKNNQIFDWRQETKKRSGLRFFRMTADF